MGIKFSDLSRAQRSLIEGHEEPLPPRARILRRPTLERDEQCIFANWCLLNGLPFCWHATHKPSTASRGVSDFWVGKDSRSAWFEFKSASGGLTEDQVFFAQKLEAHAIEFHVVRSAAEAIAIVKGWSK